jgi:hypothetical protein
MASMLFTLSEGFTNASIRGTYAVTCIGQGGHNQQAFIGVWTFDGKGQFAGSTITNQPGLKFAERTVVNGSVEGRYTVDENGSGYGSVAVAYTPSDGSRQEITAILLITKTETVEDSQVAQEISFMQGPVDPLTGNLNMILASRHPDGGEFSLASFSGTYGGPGIGRGSFTPAAAIGIGAVHFDGKGGFTAVDIQNLSGVGFAERQNASFDTPNGKYIVEKEGTGMIIAPGGQANFVIFKAKVVDNVKIALEHFAITNDLHPPTGSLVTTTVSKRVP